MAVANHFCRLREVASSAPEKTGGHRALDDIHESIVELRHYREHLFTRP